MFFPSKKKWSNNQAFLMDGSSYLSIDNPTFMNLGKGSISMWVKFPSLLVSTYYGFRSVNKYDEALIYSPANGNKPRYNISTGGSVVSNAVVVPTIKRHVLFSYNGSIGTYYDQSVFRLQVVNNALMAGYQFNIGWVYMGQIASRLFMRSGSIVDEVTIYSDYLTTTEINEIYAGNALVDPRTLSSNSKIISYYPLEGNTLDKVGPNHLTVVGVEQYTVAL